MLRVWSTIQQASPATSAFHEDAVRQYYSGKVGKFTIFWCEISSGFCSLKQLKSNQFSRSYLNYKKGPDVFRDTVHFAQCGNGVLYLRRCDGQQTEMRSGRQNSQWWWWKSMVVYAGSNAETAKSYRMACHDKSRINIIQHINVDIITERALPVAATRVWNRWRRGSVVRTSVFGWRTFRDLYSTSAVWLISWVTWPLWVSQPGQLSLPSLRRR